VEFENQHENTQLCGACGERPAVIDVTFVANGQRRHGGLCTLCAGHVAQRQMNGGLGGGPFVMPFGEMLGGAENSGPMGEGDHAVRTRKGRCPPQRDAGPRSLRA
jgi:hypothetical protein